MSTSGRRMVLIALFSLVATIMLQGADQSIQGVVRDESGGVVPGVLLRLVHTPTNEVRQLRTDEQGRYHFTAIRTGDYRLEAELPGFQPVIIKGITVRVGDALNYPIHLAVGPITNEFEILAEAEQVQVTTSQLDTVIDGKTIRDLPLNGRNPLDLIFLLPGVIPTSGRGEPSVNGNRFRGNNYQLDGMDNNMHHTYGRIVEINVDATAEFQVIRSNPSAEYGRTGGAVIDMITRSGTNQFHGNVFWFHRNENLDATRWEDNALGVGKPNFERNQFGSSLGGPIIPDRLFFFFNTQLSRIRRRPTIRLWVPTSDFRNSVTNPYVRTIFNSYYPLPNTDIDNLPELPNIIGEYDWSTHDHENLDQFMGKLDYRHSTRHNFSLRIFSNFIDDDFYTWAPFPTTDMNDGLTRGSSYSAALEWNWTISSTMINTAKVSFNNYSRTWKYAESPLDEVSFFGPDINFLAFHPIGHWSDEAGRIGTFELKNGCTWIHNAHVLKVGIDLRYNLANLEGNRMFHPQYFFGTYNPVAAFQDIRNGQVRSVSQTVNGNGERFVLGYIPEYKIRSWEYDLFFQDDWKVTPTVTLNLGLRYEWKPPHREINGFSSNIPNDQMVGNGYHLVNPNNFFDPNNWDNGDWSTGNPIWVGTGADIYLAGKSRDLYNAPKTNFAPRLGFSWDVFGDGRTALRGGYGISFDRNFGNVVWWSTDQFPFAAALNHATAITGGYNGICPDGVAYYGHGYAIPGVDLHPQPLSITTDVFIIYNENFHQPYIQTWNFSLQKELGPGNILRVAYAGSAGVHLMSRGNPNQMAHPSPELIQALAENGFGTNVIPEYIARYCAQNTQFYRYHYIDQFAHSTYHALQTSFQRRFQQGIQFAANYTWSKALDNSSEGVIIEGGSSPFASDWYNRDYDRGYSSYDVRHIFTANVIWELPFGPGMWLGTDSRGLLANLIGGWQVNAILKAHSGYPLDYKVMQDTLGTGYTNNVRSPARPFVSSTSFTTGQSHPINRGYIQTGPTANNFLWSTEYINLYTPQGNYYRGSFRGPGYSSIDISLFKDFSIPWMNGEKARLQLRLEAFNLFNHPHFLLPGTVLGRPYIGYSDHTETDSERQVQLGIKFIF